ncbi:MAG: hypothetical protein HZB51_07325 [Chloroflexi bacterium]|nr:hypothetical protein [Chloroflexota bacterium]
MLIPQFIATISAISDLPPSSAAPLPSVIPTASPELVRARAVLARVREEIIPREGQSTNYGVTFSDAGYETLIKWNEQIKVDAHCANGYESLNLLLPCCDWAMPSRDEEKNCACGHHQALEGLSKKLLHDGWDSHATQSEVTKWTRFLFPVEALTQEMERRAQLDPEIKQALDELIARGEC